MQLRASNFEASNGFHNTLPETSKHRVKSSKGSLNY